MSQPVFTKIYSNISYITNYNHYNVVVDFDYNCDTDNFDLVDWRSAEGVGVEAEKICGEAGQTQGEGEGAYSNDEIVEEVSSHTVEEVLG